MFCATTTCFIKHDSDSVYAELDYQMIQRDHGYGCGVVLAVYILNSVQFECLGQFDTDMPESINIKVKPNSTKCFLVSFVYLNGLIKCEYIFSYCF